jgi:hypothetical protein
MVPARYIYTVSILTLINFHWNSFEQISISQLVGTTCTFIDMASDLVHSGHDVTSAASQVCGQPSSNMTRLRFLDLPFELRLSIYHSIVMTGLDEDESSDIRNTLLSCRQIHREMDDEYISKARSLLNAIHSWKTISEETKLLQMQFKTCSTFAETIRTPTIEIPTTVFPKKDAKRHFEWISNEDLEPWRALGRALHPVFCLPHFTLTMRIVGRPCHYRPLLPDQLYWAAYCVRGIDKPPQTFQQTKRLVLRFNSSIDINPGTSFNLLCVSMYDKILFPSSVPLPIPVRTWAAKEVVEGEEQMLYYGFDFEEGLPQFPGSVQCWNCSDWPEFLR